MRGAERNGVTNYSTKCCLQKICASSSIKIMARKNSRGGGETTAGVVERRQFFLCALSKRNFFVAEFANACCCSRHFSVLFCYSDSVKGRYFSNGRCMHGVWGRGKLLMLTLWYLKTVDVIVYGWCQRITGCSSRRCFPYLFLKCAFVVSCI